MNDLIRDSIFQNLKIFCQDLTDKEMSDLNNYLISDFTEKPSSVQERFYKEFFDEKEWLEFVRVAKLKVKPSFSTVFRTTSELTEIRTLFSYFVQRRFEKLVKSTKPKTVSTRIKLKRELKNAIEESYFDGEFDKCDGFCNITDVLISHKLLKPFKEE